MIPRVFLPRGILDQCKTPNELIEYVGAAIYPIKLPQNDRNSLAWLSNPKIRKRPNPLYHMLYNFIRTNVPSDFYLIKKPGFELRYDSALGGSALVKRQPLRH